MSAYEVSFEIDVPDEATHQDVLAFVEFYVGVRAELKRSPLSDRDLESVDARHVCVREIS